MGLSIHYSGIFNRGLSGASLSEMIDEVQDIVEIYKWQYTIYEREFPPNSFDKEAYDDKIYGISFTPPECETINMCFLSNGRMSSLPNLKFFGNPTDETHKKYLYMLSVKTQFAGSNTHKLIIHLFKYLSEKYFQDFKVIDEGQYWETGDEKILEANFKRYNELMNLFGSALENIPIKSTETFEEYFERIIKIIHRKRNQ
ncbi:MAG: hypothetical protein KJ666_11495 [Bacteroidetes bacterium]|nr:hypothetical protein [Bacteroidota bacterium]MBU2446175.1 hypothetical protein [Bacteroidota bacterium]